MSTTVCPKRFQAEALRDGRLSDAERASFNRHMTMCAACAREVQALEGLAHALRSTFAEPVHADELHVHRQRIRLSAAFDRTLVSEERVSRRRVRWLWPMAVSALVLLAVIVWGRGPSPMNVIPSAVVQADRDAVWSKYRDEKSEKVTLERGTLWIHIEHGRARNKGRFVVLLPDGELEDQGTTFTVSAEHGQTNRVTVEEGRVVLRIRGQRSVTIGPGGTWSSQTRVTESESLPTVAPAAASPPPSTPSLPKPPVRPASRTHAHATKSPAPSESALADPFVEYRAAMTGFQAGDNVGAAAAFASFVTRYPRDPRAEDAAYLRVIALQRCGAALDMKRAAEEYLRRYPEGFRHAEVDRLFRDL